MIYQSQPIGLDNLWDLWTNDINVAVISIRGTTEKPESWLANFYAAMVPAKGELKLNDKEVFPYQLATNPKAAVHIGWLLSMAYLSKEGYTGNVGFHFATNPFVNKKVGKNITLGLRSGYYIPIDKATKWTTNGNSIQAGPKINSQGFYGTFIFGIAL